MYSGYLPMSLLFFILFLGISNYLTLNQIALSPVINQAAPLRSFSERDAIQADRVIQYPAASQNSLSVYTDEEKKLRIEALKRVEADRRGVLEMSKGTDHKLFYRSVKPGALCRNNERIGAKGDGGKQACNVKAVRKDQCTLVSLGLHNQIDYDIAIHKATGGHCKILGVDKSEQNAKTKDTYSKINGQLFVGMIPTEISLPDMLKQAGRNEVDLLKIDIEGGEFTGLEPLIKDYLVCQIMIEIHGTPAEHLSLLRIITNNGFRIFNVEPNPFCGKCCEYSLINELCMTQYGAIPLGNTIPN
ncbi:hypothetical protein CAEBREN_26240 [Caenorhabditis brenneri]|uniref:Methyltransferase FkbM domain-containing protein n=1 Tax=Caenorhabditis brenneri TaxID=135651 RepID=G0MR64_CAEBE|nr:hypothetical protein CAEBREN_26240 [Caenorhabditis brenneri]